MRFGGSQVSVRFGLSNSCLSALLSFEGGIRCWRLLRRLLSTAPGSRAAMAGSAIEIEVAGMIVRVHGQVVADALVEVLAAVKRAR
jgi:hypothetical protein